MRTAFGFIIMVVLGATTVMTTTESKRATAEPRADAAMPSIEQMMVNSHDLSVQQFAAY